MTDITWQPVTVRLADLTPWERNPKRISKAHASRLLDLWQRLGQFQTIAIGPAGEVYDGHQRLSVLKAKHGTGYEVQALQSSRALTEAEREELTIAAHVGTVGQFDWDALSGWDADNLQAWGLDGETLTNWQADIGALGAMLASEEEPPQDDPGAQIDRAEELREKWGVEPGQLWQLGEHRLIVGDCTDAGVVARVMGGERAALMVTDPPYGVEYDPERRFVVSQKKIGGAQGKVTNDNRADWSDAWALFSGDVVYIWCADVFSPVVAQSIDACGFERRSLICWAKNVAPPLAYGINVEQVERWGLYHHQHELCWYAVRQGSTAKWIGDRKQTTLWQIDKPQNSETGHSTQKPIDCMERPIRNHDAPIVYDPFLGSGTTLIACERLGRRCRAIEISPAYCAVTIQRWHDMTGGEPVLLP